MSSQNRVDFHVTRISVETEDLGRRSCCCSVRQIYPCGTVGSEGDGNLCSNLGVSQGRLSNIYISVEI